MSLTTSTNSSPAPTNPLSSTAARKLFEGLRTDFNTVSTQPPLFIFLQPPRTTLSSATSTQTAAAAVAAATTSTATSRADASSGGAPGLSDSAVAAIAIASTSVFILILIILFFCISRICNTYKRRKKSTAVDSLPRQQYRQLHNTTSNIPRNSDSNSPTNKTGNPSLDALIGNTPTFHERTPGKSYIITPKIVAGGLAVRASPAVVASAQMATTEEMQPIVQKKEDGLLQASIQILEEQPIKGASPL
ncbi:hypothetical protein HDU81_007129 [Chytriomyces hyalinus]|nr:hypothetical protein HDU81_007129 [Chytriomyces hyalinus]